MDNIKRYVPKCYSDVRELEAIYNVETNQLSNIEAQIFQVYDNYFVQHSDMATIRDWENTLKITANPNESIEQRREKVLIKLSSTVPFNELYMRNLLSNHIENYNITIDSVLNTLTIVLLDNDVSMLDFIHAMLISIIPAHIDFRIYLGLSIDTYPNEYYGCATNQATIYDNYAVLTYNKWSDYISGTWQDVLNKGTWMDVLVN